MNAKKGHDTVCNGNYHIIRWEGQNIVKCNECGFAPRDSKLKKVRDILWNLIEYDLDDIKAETITKCIAKAIAIIDSEYETEEAYNEIMEKVFGEPYPTEDMIKEKYIDDLVEMEMECDAQDRVGATIGEVRKYFEDLDYDELKVCWDDSPYNKENK